jgi:hypothetical protein
MATPFRAGIGFVWCACPQRRQRLRPWPPASLPIGGGQIGFAWRNESGRRLGWRLLRPTPSLSASPNWLCSAQSGSDWNTGMMEQWNGGVSAWRQIGFVCTTAPPAGPLSEIGFVLHNRLSSARPRPTRRRRELGSFCTISSSHRLACLSGGKLGSFCTIGSSHRLACLSRAKLGSFCTISSSHGLACLSRAKLGSFCTIGRRGAEAAGRRAGVPPL